MLTSAQLRAPQGRGSFSFAVANTEPRFFIYFHLIADYRPASGYPAGASFANLVASIQYRNSHAIPGSRVVRKSVGT